MAALSSSIKRLLSVGSPLYKRVDSTNERTGQGTSPSNVPENEEEDDDDDDDLYNTDDEIAHGKFVYCAFLMLGISFVIYVNFNRTSDVIT